MSDIRFLRRLEKVAMAVPASVRNKQLVRTRFAAGIVHKNEMVSIGVNQLKSHPFQAKFSKHEESIFLHAETCAIKNALRVLDLDDLKKSTLYICRVKKSDRKTKSFVWGISKPCAGCMKAIIQYEIKNVVYTCDGGEYQKL